MSFLRKLSFLFISIVIPLSCLPEDQIPNKPLNQFDLFIDPSFDKDQIEAINQSALSWNERANEIIHFNIHLAPLIQQEIGPNEFIVLNQSPPPGYTGWTIFYKDNFSYKRGHVLLASYLPPMALLPVVKHEMGHIIGLPHNKGPYPSIMAFPPYHYDEITCADLINFCQIWKCQIECDPNFP